MKKFGIMFTIIALLVITTACGSSNTANNNSGNKAANKTVLTMGTSAEFYPYEFIDTASGSEEVQGFDIDIANYIANELGFEIKIENMDFGGLIAALQTGRVDFVISGMTPTPERAEKVDFSMNYFEQHNTIVAFKEGNLTTIEDLNGKKVGVQLGSIQEELAKTIEGAEVISLNKIPEVIQELISGRIDAVILEDTVAKGYTNKNSDLEYTIIPSDEANGSAIAFPKGSDKVEQFNNVIKKMQENGEMDKLIAKWFQE